MKMTLTKRRVVQFGAAMVAKAGITALILSACGDPDPEPATWGRVSQIFDESGCAEAGSCHSAARADGGLVLDGDDAYDELVGVACSNPGADETGLLRVVANDVENSFLWTKVTQPGYSPIYGDRMPPLGEALSDNEQDILRRWIEAGAPRD
jgi:hypothetical protein